MVKYETLKEGRNGFLYSRIIATCGSVWMRLRSVRRRRKSEDQCFFCGGAVNLKTKECLNADNCYSFWANGG